MGQFGWLLVTGGTKVKTALGPATRQLKGEGALVLAGCGPNTAKVVTIAEVIKRRNKQVQQITRMGEKTVREFWDPKTEDLDPLVVTRIVPTLHILLSKNRHEGSEAQQPPGFVVDSLWGDVGRRKNTRNKRKEAGRGGGNLKEKEDVGQGGRGGGKFKEKEE